MTTSRGVGVPGVLTAMGSARGRPTLRMGGWRQARCPAWARVRAAAGFPCRRGRLGDGEGAGGVSGAAGALVGGVVPGHGQAGDDGGHAAADDERVPGGELADHVGGHDRVAGVGVVLVAVAAEDGAGFFHGGGAAQGGRGVEGGGVGDAGEPDLGAGGVHDDAGAVGAPPAAELGFAVGDGDDLDALAAGVGQPGRDRDGADLGDLVQGHQQRRVEPAAGQQAAGQGGDVVDLAGQAGEQRRDRGVLAAGLGDQVQRPGVAQERGDVQRLALVGQDARGEGGVGEERQAAAHGHPDGGDGLVRLAAHLGELVGEVAGGAGRGGEDVLGFVGAGCRRPSGRRAAGPGRRARRRGSSRAGSPRPWRPRSWRPRRLSG